MCDIGIWDRDTTTMLIMAYETYPNLYVTKNSDYKLKTKRMDSLSNIKKLLLGCGVDVSVEDINKKIHSLRTQFFKEYAKVKKSLVSGAGTQDIYVPKLWCYELLKFLVTSDPVRSSSSNLDIENAQENVNPSVNSFNEPEFLQPGCSGSSCKLSYDPNPERNTKPNDNESQEYTVLYDGPAENIEKLVQITPPPKKIKKSMEKEAIQLISNASNVLNAISQKTLEKTRYAKEVDGIQEDIQAFGSFIVEELKKIGDENELRVVKREIMNSIWNGQERAAAKRLS